MRSKILTSIKKWYKTGAWPSDPTTKQTLFCLMQRAFFKENGFPYAEIAKPFRSLFFETAHTPIPEEDRMGGWYDDWAKKYGGDIDSAIRAVRAIHAENPCDDTIP